MSEEEFKKCSYIKGGYADNMCTHLQNVGQIHSKGKGVNFGQMVNFETNEKLGVLVSVKSGARSKDGLAFNFCPFCRGPLIDPDK
jgi:hypothetical protein